MTHSPNNMNIIKACPPSLRKKLHALRALILDVAKKTEGVGKIEESLKWGQPTFVPAKPRTGSPIRIDRYRDSDTQYALYMHCQTNLAETFRERFPGAFTYEKNRALIFDVDTPLPETELRECIALALTYHLRKR